MRLDKYLKVSRLIKRRTVANEACDAGKVLVNEKIARASYDVKVGDVIAIQMGQKELSVRVEKVPEFVTKEDAVTLYTVLSKTLEEKRLWKGFHRRFLHALALGKNSFAKCI